MNATPGSPAVTLGGDSNVYLNYKRDGSNYITQLFGAQLPAIKTGLFNIHMSKGMIVQPHWHTNATELVFVISGEIVTSVFDPHARKLLTYKLTSGQVCVLPQGWFHWIIVMSEHTHFLTVFNVPTPDIVYGSDFLKSIPPEVMKCAYNLDPGLYAETVSPIRESVIIGPPLPPLHLHGYASRRHPGYPYSL